MREELKLCEDEYRNDIRRAVKGEMDGEEHQWGGRPDVGGTKNTHYEYHFGEDGEVVLYLERLGEELGRGLELMLWVEDSHIDESGDVTFASLSICGDEIEALGEYAATIVRDESGWDGPDWEFQQWAGESGVFHSLFYME